MEQWLRYWPLTREGPSANPGKRTKCFSGSNLVKTSIDPTVGGTKYLVLLEMDDELRDPMCLLRTLKNLWHRKIEKSRPQGQCPGKIKISTTQRSQLADQLLDLMFKIQCKLPTHRVGPYTEKVLHKIGNG